MRRCAVDKKVAGIIRWLERLKKSYSDGAIESALMEAECACADLENLRNDVWQKVKPSKHKSLNNMILSFLRCVSLAAVVILFYVTPLEKDNVPSMTVTEEMKALTQTQPKPIIIVREYEKPEVKATSKPEKPEKRSSRRQVTQRKASENPKPISQKTVPYDKVLSLVQTGQRALKENSSVISIKK